MTNVNFLDAAALYCYFAYWHLPQCSPRNGISQPGAVTAFRTAFLCRN